MPGRKTFTGGCHCGQVRFECTSDLAMVTACNCSICTKKGLHFTFVSPNLFQLRAGEDNGNICSTSTRSVTSFAQIAASTCSPADASPMEPRSSP